MLYEDDREAVERAAVAFENGGVVLHPTDTVFGLCADPENKKATQKIFTIKKREANKIPLLLAKNANTVATFVRMPEKARELSEHWPAPLTLVLPRKKHALPGFFPESETLAFRVPKHDFSLQFLEKVNRPIISTSANISEQETPDTFDRLTKVFPMEFIDVAVASRKPLDGKPSTVVHISDTNETSVFRHGAFQMPFL